MRVVTKTVISRFAITNTLRKQGSIIKIGYRVTEMRFTEKQQVQLAYVTMATRKTNKCLFEDRKRMSFFL